MTTPLEALQELVACKHEDGSADIFADNWNQAWANARAVLAEARKVPCVHSDAPLDGPCPKCEQHLTLDEQAMLGRALKRSATQINEGGDTAEDVMSSGTSRNDHAVRVGQRSISPSSAGAPQNTPDGLTSQCRNPESPSPDERAELLAELRDSAFELRQSDPSVGIFADEGMADILTRAADYIERMGELEVDARGNAVRRRSLCAMWKSDRERHMTPASTPAATPEEVAKLIERIRALADCAWWANCGWDIPGDSTQTMGRLAVKAADALTAEHAARVAAEAERDRAIEVADAETNGVYSKYMLEAADAIAENRHNAIRANTAEYERDAAEARVAALTEALRQVQRAMKDGIIVSASGDYHESKGAHAVKDAVNAALANDPAEQQEQSTAKEPR